MIKEEQQQIIIKKRCEFDDSVQKHHTPWKLCREIILQLVEYTDSKFWDKPDILVMFNLEFVHILISEFDVNPENITFTSDSEGRRNFAEKILRVNILEDNLFELMRKDKVGENIMKKQFDVILGNPPYQGVSTVKRKGKEYQGSSDARNNLLWPGFVKMGLEICKDNGHLCLVHPPKWRKPEDALLDVMTGNQIEYLEIHSKKDGEETFGATTRYDWYVLKKTPCDGKTIIKDEKGNISSHDLREVSFIPNYYFSEIAKIVAVGDEPTLDVLRSTVLHTQNKNHMSNNSDDEFKYPCVHGSTLAGIDLRYSNDDTSGFFGVKKVILNDGETIYSVNDYEGKYGITQHTFAIKVSSKTEAENIKKAVNSDAFKEIIKATKWSSYQADYKMFKSFRKDFWKEFV